MEWYAVGLSLLALLMFFIAIGLLIPFALTGASLPFLWQIQSFETSIVSAELKLWGVWIDYILLSVPLFVFLGELIGKSRIGPNLYQFLSFELSPYMVLGIVLLFYILLGMFLEPVSMTFITLPTIYPMMNASGFDLIWFGIIYTITMEIAVLTPPVGLNLCVIQGIGRGQVTISDVIMGCLPFIGASVLLIVTLILMPQIALWLPNQI